MIWYKDINNFLDTNYLLDIVPTEKMTLTVKLNALFRFSIYASIILYALSNNVKSFLISALFAGITIAIYNSNRANYDREGYNDAETDVDRKFDIDTVKQHYTVPTKQNPFMNVLMNEYTDNPKRKKAIYNDAIKKEVDKYFNEDLYRSIDDIYQKNASDRQYYTMPSTVIPNDQDKFANWLYGIDGKTCKEGNGLKCKYFS
jgi:hypothetical protein